MGKKLEYWRIFTMYQSINNCERKLQIFKKWKKVKKEESFSISSLHGAGKLSHTRKCLFCYKTDQYSNQFQIVTDLKARREILKKNKICFKCLKPGHTRPNCKNSKNVIDVKKEGDHHTTLCNPNKVSDNTAEEEIICLVKNNTKLLLQTANA